MVHRIIRNNMEKTVVGHRANEFQVSGIFLDSNSSCGRNLDNMSKNGPVKFWQRAVKEISVSFVGLYSLEMTKEMRRQHT